MDMTEMKINGKKLAYARVSTKEQNLDRQIAAFKEMGIDDEDIFLEKQSGRNANRPELNRLMDYCRKGDVIYIESLSRFSRSLGDLVTLMAELEKKGVALVSLKESAINTSTASGRLVANLFSVLAEFEWDLRRERQAEGIRIAKQKEIYKGREKGKYDIQKFRELSSAVSEGKITKNYACKSLGVSHTTFWKFRKLDAVHRLEEYLYSSATYEDIMRDVRDNDPDCWPLSTIPSRNRQRGDNV